MSNAGDRILVIKLGALGDIIQALGPMQAVRDHHPNAHITCMTTGPYHDLITATGWFDDIWVHRRPSNIDLIGWWTLRNQLRKSGFSRVYDLQTSSRSNRLFRMLWPGPYPEWSGNAAGCSHPHKNPDRDSMHTIERQAEQLADAGIGNVPLPSLDRLGADVAHLDLPEDYCVIVPGGAAHRPDKRWPVERYCDVARRISDAGVAPVIIGVESEAALAAKIADAADNAINLAGQTPILSLISVIKSAKFALGNDSGPMHIAAVAGLPSVVLYSHASDPALCAQRGSDVTILRKPGLDALSVDEVMAALPVGNP